MKKCNGILKVNGEIVAEVVGMTRMELPTMKLFKVDVIDNCENESILVVADSKENAELKVRSMDWNCLMVCCATEVKEIDGYKIKLERK